MIFNFFPCVLSPVARLRAEHYKIINSLLNEQGSLYQQCWKSVRAIAE